MVDTVAPPHRLTFDNVLRMVEAGILDEDDRVELVDGVLVDMSPISPQHSGAVAWLNQHFAGANAGALAVRVQDQLVLREGPVPAAGYAAVTVHGEREQLAPLAGGPPVCVAALLGL